MKLEVLKKTIRYIMIFCVTVLILTMLKIISCMIPDSPIQQNLKKSVSLIEEEGQYPQHFINYPEDSYIYAGYRIDTITEYAILGTTYTSCNNAPLKSAFRNSGIGGCMPEDISRYFLSEMGEMSERCQYWMGLTVIERLVYTFLDMASFREILVITFSLLFFCVLLSVYQKFGLKVAVPFVVASLLVNIWVVQFSPNFCITFLLAYIFILIIEKFYQPDVTDCRFMLVFGILTAFFDWLSTPLVTFGLPMIIILMLYEDRDLEIVHGIKLLLGNGIAWICGYVGMVFSKWILGSFILKNNILVIGLSRMIAGTSNSLEGEPKGFIPLAILSLKNNFLTLYPFTFQPNLKKYLFFFGIFGILVIFAIVFHKPWKKCGVSYLLLVVSMAPYAWFIVFKGHCHIHYWFTYRIQVIFVMAFLTAFLCMVDNIKINIAMTKMSRRINKNGKFSYNGRK